MTTTVLPTAAFGVSGNTSQMMLNRVGSLALDDTEGTTATPDVALIFGFPNDPVNSVTQADTQLYCQAMLLAIKHGAYGDQTASAGAYVAGQATLPATGRRGQRMVVLSDTSTTGGLAALDASQTARIGGTVAGSGLAVWEFRRRRAGEDGWGRVAISSTAPTKCKRVVIISAGYKNYFTDGGGSGAAVSAGKRDLTGTPETYYAQVRAAQQAAVAAENVAVGGKASVIYADLYTYMRTMIVGGTFPSSGSPTLSETFAAGYVPDFSGGATYVAAKDWHYQANNQHHNEFGHEIVARAAFMAIINAGWSAALIALAIVNLKALGDSQTDYGGGYCRASRTWAPTLTRLLQEYLDTL